MMRLDKLLCELNIGTRSQVKELLQKGFVLVDGETVKRPETKVAEEKVRLCVQGREYTYRRFVYYMLNKPAGVVSATRDHRERTVLDLVDGTVAKDLFPVGRLDKDTEGLVLLTNDGALAHALLSPGRHVTKTYRVGLARPLPDEAFRRLERGVDIGEKRPTLPAKAERGASELELFLSITEGKFHQVKRMLLAVGNEVVSLKRLRMGGLVLDETLAPGAYRELTEQEQSLLFQNQAASFT